MSHDVKKFKLLKKIVGIFGYKIIDKSSAKTERLIDNFTLKIENILDKLINQNKINKILQVGANDGKSDDFLFKNLNKNSDAILIEPMNDAFIKLNENYKEFKKVKCLNLALGLDNNKKNIFSVDPKYFEFYKNKYKDKNVNWLNVLASFHKEHLINHGIKDKHITSKNIQCTTFKNLLDEYNYHNLDLLITDTEGYDITLINNFIETIKTKPIIIFEWIHGKEDEVNLLLKKLKNNNYVFFKIGRDLVCFQKDYKFS